MKQADPRQIEQSFFDQVSDLAGDNLLLYCVTGSLARNEFVANWSDIDILIVVRTYSSEIFESWPAIAQGFEDSPIKIGVTIYALNEFNSQYFKDRKTYLSIELISDGTYKPRVKHQDIHLPKVTPTLAANLDIAEFGTISHLAKRELMKGPRLYKEKKVYKLIITLLKIMLRRRDVTTLGYMDTLNALSKILPQIKTDLMLPSEIIRDASNSPHRFDKYIELLNTINNYHHDIF